jgi:hypothetical protein
MGVTGYKVFIDDNFHCQDQSDRETHGMVATAAEALAVCRSIVDDFLYECGSSQACPQRLYTSATRRSGHDPFMVPIYPNGPSVSFPRGIMPVADVWTLPDRWAARKPPL